MDGAGEFLLYDGREISLNLKGDQLKISRRTSRHLDSLRDSELRYRRLFEAAQDGILILDAGSGAITDVNPFLINLLGFSRGEFMEKRLWEMGAFKDIKASKEAFKALQTNEYIRYKDLPLRAKNGELIAVEFVSNVYQAGDEKVIQCNIRDITDRKIAQENLLKSKELFREQSFRDHLTGLYNRRFLEETLERELHRASRKNYPVGVIMSDVDFFKYCNDTFGHAAGDELLRRIAELMQKNVRSEDVPSRYGGDEFIILLPDASRDVAKSRAEHIREIIHLNNFQFEGASLEPVTLSFGVSVFPEDGVSAEKVLRAADDALYFAKNDGRDRVVAANEIHE